MTINAEVRRLTGWEAPRTRASKRPYEARIGAVTARAPTRAEAIAEVEAEVLSRCSGDAKTRAHLLTRDGKIFVVCKGSYDLLRVSADGRELQASWAGVGETFQETLEVAYRHAEQAFGGVLWPTHRPSG